MKAESATGSCEKLAASGSANGDSRSLQRKSRMIFLSCFRGRNSDDSSSSSFGKKKRRSTGSTSDTKFSKKKSNNSKDSANGSSYYSRQESVPLLTSAPPAPRAPRFTRIQNMIKAEEILENAAKNGIAEKSGNDFSFVRSIGEGSYSTVYRVRDEESKIHFAAKVIQKANLYRNDKLESAIRERDILVYLTESGENHPFIPNLYTTFQDVENFYLISLVAERGTLDDMITRFTTLSVPHATFYASEILAGLEFIHGKNIIHRDLKPENILIKEDGHIMIADFGSAQVVDNFTLPSNKFQEEDQYYPAPPPPVTRDYRRMLDDDEEEEPEPVRRSTFVGTAQYISPEMLTDGDVGPSTDVWGFACILFQSLYGQPPFRAVNQYHLLKKIRDLDFAFPDEFPPLARDLLASIFVLDPASRSKISDIKDHEFFRKINWDKILVNDPPRHAGYTPKSYAYNDFDLPLDMDTGYTDFAIQRMLNMKKPMKRLPGVGLVNGEQQLATFEFDDTLEGPSDMAIKPVQMDEATRARLLERQRIEHPYHLYVDNHLILRSGFVYKKRGLFSRRRMFLLTEGPHLFYVDPDEKILKGEIPWSPCMRTEARNFRAFLIHTPNRVYYMFDPDRRALEWCQAIEDTAKLFEVDIARIYQTAMREGTFDIIYGKKRTEKELAKEEKARLKKRQKEEKKRLKRALRNLRNR
ncbi:unnamed protein product [Caenorhabditis auriculariae]|uniref:3-phosphoinositide-dependent protein kinase 1 n=1 Tax=Caenorhabditis auriculariae TaxID=2777116 RepID=A0A8S1HVJ7_9PELO|nr:unnamed protein product [Caenorhabditis auriculariae]